MSDVKAPAPNPCGSCPYRCDTPSGVWAEEEYRKLPEYDADMAFQPPGLFLCHQNDRGSDQSRLCAGWVGTHGAENLLALRLAAVFGNMSDRQIQATVDYSTSVPLFASGAEAAEHGIRDIECPGEDAERAISKISTRRDDVRMG
ncbi:hypothetical protein SEA_LUMOS_119 [Mycobacterium phage Lumos]|uniref:Uncharacterized protein n=1 Tax=Mycobacterium phage Lumos TaxID=1701852 RepID=A0A0K2CM18_9CAUD|nr:hypothetical protein AVU96_gp071 [Mycobacterium phage Snenia]YP_010012567.1 hypothetical protein J4T93_gp069 [Mycobacterium phage Lumos]ASM62846.1 hypothetical protein SEA_CLAUTASTROPHE_118 [Mycobacterium phage Clautastrophe]QDF16693.1 hypothetical protein PBI_MSGREEN_120 [Mycobacterium phage MsGreen]QPL14993.1 hypothetical protein SEA_JUBIE_119 [Mycobacterium phage Jubie]ALA06625.1 hypothetical protein SEA_LUMOS_119 [Mycobacterium phage Lumos]ALF01564.1 hypothetical protein SNENIA_118 [My